jgi:ribosome-binding factor A
LRGDFPVNLRARAESLPPCQITITYVDISPDLRNATIYFTTSADATGDAALKFFEVQKYYLRNLIAKQIKLKFVPSISFKIDESVANAKKIENLLDPLRTSIVD